MHNVYKFLLIGAGNVHLQNFTLHQTLLLNVSVLSGFRT